MIQMRRSLSTNAELVAVAGCIRGHVQGVSFRYSMQQAATDLGLAGWVRNLPDRSVAFHAEGPNDAVDALLRWCESGPPPARVDSVDAEPCEVHRFESFDILP